jgi:hypothetical protein
MVGDEDTRPADAVADTMAATPGSGGSAPAHPLAISGDPGTLQVVSASAYVLGRELARGGMGRILEAHDRRHDRPVAIKMLLRDGDDALARFVREAAITSRLQHPAIVPVYEAGRWPSGEPFFAMKLVEGRSLDRAIAQAPDLAARLTLLPKLVAVTEALAYAHGRGVIHRDLKPHNVLCGDFGETVVIDWGLAKRRGAGLELSGPDSLPPSESDSLTVVGAAVGTPRYMPPEQARGENVDERSDVYSLGAMLYHLVAGVAPYEGTSGSAVERVIEGPPPALADRAPGAPRDLCTIVAKAMAREPRDRYPSAAELAAELRRFINGQRVAAHDYSIATLARRFVARNRVTVAVAAALLIALAATGYVGVHGIMRERNIAIAERTSAQTERNKALAERGAAEELVDFIQSDLRERLEPSGRIELLEGVGSRVEAYYQKTGSNDLAAKARRASALDLVGYLAVITDDGERSQGSYTAALALRTEVARANPTDATAQRQLALAIGHVAKGKEDRNDLPGAMAGYQEALTAARRAAELAPGDVKNQLALVDALSALAISIDHNGRSADAATFFIESLALARKVVAEHPEYRGRLAEILELTGSTERQGGRYEAGRAAILEALVIRRALVAEDPTDTRRHAAEARAHRMLAGAYVDEHDWPKALEEYREERAILQRLLTIEPDNTRWQYFLAENHLDTGDRLRDQDDVVGAEREYAAGLVIAERRAQKQPDDSQAQFTLANFHSALGDLLAHKDDRGAVAHYQIAQRLVDALAAASPTNLRWRYAAVRTRGGAANGYLELGQHATAHVEFGKALDELDAMLEIEPAAAVYLNLRAELAVLDTASRTDEPDADRAALKVAARRALAAIDGLRAKATVPDRILAVEPELKKLAAD